MWTLNPLPNVQKRLERFKKKWPRELENVFVNLAKLKQALDLDAKPEQVKQEFSFVHGNYELGVLSIDQRGKNKGAKPKPFRLYVYPDEVTQTLHIITLGDKDTQPDDVKEAKAFVQGLLARSTKVPEKLAKDGNEESQDV
jgi:hypothetical protein